MKVLESKLRSQLLKTEILPFGELHFFKNVIISEINNGAHIDADKYIDLIILLAEFYGTEKSFGFISNRVNNYSISPVEISKINTLDNISASSTITYSDSDTKTAKFEHSFCKIKLKNNFSDLYLGYNWVNELVTNKISLN